MNDDDEHHGTVVVGYEGIEHRADALLVAAAREAEHRGLTLAIVTTPRYDTDLHLDPAAQRRARLHAEAVAVQNLHQVTLSVQAAHPALTIAAYCLSRGEVTANREPLRTSSLLVIGMHDSDGRQTVADASISRALVAGSRSPVLFIPENLPSWAPVAGPSRLVIAAISDHPADIAVVRAAYAQVAGRDDQLVLLHVCPRQPDPSGEPGEELLAPYLAQAPTGVRATTVLVRDDDPAAVLLESAQSASLLIIGGRTGPLSGVIHGSVSQAILRIVPCPVLAVPRELDAGPSRPIRGIALTSTARR